jgi:HemK-related putative methylase
MILDEIKKALNNFNSSSFQDKKINFLDMGTGSGIISLNIFDKVDSVYAVDIDQEAINCVHEEINHLNLKRSKTDKIKNIHLMKSNLFDNLKMLKGNFNIISFNTPYLPNEPKNSIIENDIALNGGPKGYEVTVEFLKQAKDYLANDGFLIVLFSSRTKRNTVLKYAKEYGYAAKLLKRKGLFFEKLYVYKFTPNEYFLAQGKRGKIYQFNDKKSNKKFIKKISLESSKAVGNLKNEANFNKLLNDNGIGPKFIEYNSSKDYLVREFVEGEFLGEYIKNSNRKDVLNILIKITKLMLKLDELKMNKFEMTNPYKHVIVTESKEPVLIDFERFRFTPTPKNVTQFLQYLINNNTQDILKKLKIEIDREDLINLTREYKESYDKKLVLSFLKKLK